MPTNTLSEHSFTVDDEGFFTNPDEWNPELAAEMAEMIGIELDDEHLAPLEFMRKDRAETGVTPTLRRIHAAGGFDIKELYRLYPGKPVKKMAWLAGLPKPVGCV